MTTIATWDRDTLARRRDDLLAVYAEAMQVSPASAKNRRQILSSHLDRKGLQVVAALDDDELVGIGYGYLGAPGQWWHDQVREVLSIEASLTWLDGAFEVFEFPVRPAAQGRGLGRRLLAPLPERADSRPPPPRWWARAAGRCGPTGGP